LALCQTVNAGFAISFQADRFLCRGSGCALRPPEAAGSRRRMGAGSLEQLRATRSSQAPAPSRSARAR
jgi:hypothetical protein